jgi:L-fuconolactonase
VTEFIPKSREWLDQLQEEIINPDREIVDSHHHFWSGSRKGRWSDYLLKDLWKDTDSGHNIRKTVFIECRSNYRTDGPEYMRPVGETEFAVKIAEESQKSLGVHAEVSAIVSYADITLENLLDEILDAHEDAGRGLFRGIRHSGAFDENRDSFIDPIRVVAKNLFSRKDFRKGVRKLGLRGLNYESWLFHHQIKSFIDLAHAVPDTLLIMDHLGGPLGVGPYEGKQKEIYKKWKKDIDELAKCENVIIKLGGMAMPNNGFAWHKRSLPPSSDEFVAKQGKYYLHAIECFGPSRCMFESNFPVEGVSISYHVLWNGFKKIVNDFSENEKEMMFSNTATQVYKL